MKNENEPRFIPCGDSLEKMQEVLDANLETVSGGSALFNPDGSVAALSPEQIDQLRKQLNGNEE